MSKNKKSIEPNFQEEGKVSIYDALWRIRGDLGADMTVTISEDDFIIQIGKEKFIVDDSAPLDAEDQIHSFFESALWLANMRAVD